MDSSEEVAPSGDADAVGASVYHVLEGAGQNPEPCTIERIEVLA